MIEFFNLPILINHYLILSSLIFFLGVTGIFLNRKNVISILMSIELILLGVNINFLAFSYFSNDLTGQIFSFFNTYIYCFNFLFVFINDYILDCLL